MKALRPLTWPRASAEADQAYIGPSAVTYCGNHDVVDEYHHCHKHWVLEVGLVSPTASPASLGVLT